MRDTKAPTRVIREGRNPLGEEEFEHEAFGVAVLAHASWGGSHEHAHGVHMTGSRLRHSSVMTLTIRGAKMYRRHGDDRFHGTQTICEVAMSEAQWARLICSQGMGEGVPVTLLHRPAPGYTLSEPPYIQQEESSDRQANREARERAGKAIEGVRAAMACIEEALKRPTATKAHLREALEALRRGALHFEANESFHLEQFERATEKTVADAKSEVEAFVNNVARATGIDALLNGAAPVLPQAIEDRGTPS